MEKCQGEADKYGQLLNEYRREYGDGSNYHASKLESEAIGLQRFTFIRLLD